MGLTSSKSDSQTSNLNQQLSTQGASGAQSPTLTSAGNITYEDAGGQVTLAALAGMGDVVKQALQDASGVTAASVEASAAQSDASTQLLSSILATNAQLAQNSQTGGATAAIGQTNYIIWGLIGLAAAALFVFFRK
jgi:hypothetical protein